MLKLVFDVESIGLHGEGWAVGFVLLGHDGETLKEGYFACPQESALGSPEEVSRGDAVG